MNLGENCIRYCNERDKTRIKEMEKKSTPEVRHRRKQLRAQRKGFADKMKELFVVQDYFVYSEILILILTMFFLIHQYF